MKTMRNGFKGLETLIFLTVFLIFFAMTLSAQSTPETLPAGMEMKFKGVVLENLDERVLVRRYDGKEFTVLLTARTEIEEKKSNFLRGAKQYSRQDLLTGLNVEIEGTVDSSGHLMAEEIKFTQDDLRVAKTIESRVIPVESKVTEAHNRLDSAEAELEESRLRDEQLTGEVEELNQSHNLLKTDLRNVAQRTDLAIDGVNQTNSRISSLDNYEVADEMTVQFAFDSAELSSEARTKLSEFARRVNQDKGILLEVVGFASQDGNEEYNRRLSQRRAEAVVRFLAESELIPLRRIITPFGYGEMKPVAENSTREGRSQNRRVEVRLLVNQGINNELEVTSNSEQPETGTR